MVDRVSHWYQNYKHSRGNHTWEHFVVVVSQAFEVNTHHVKMMELLNLPQTGSVEEYKLHFNQSVYHILLYDRSISEILLVSHFLMGLKDDLRRVMEMHLSDTIAQAATLAAVQEHLNEKVKPHPRKFVRARHDNKTGGAHVDLWKGRQLKEYRRVNNLLFKCGEKYTPAHTCMNPEGAMHLIEQAIVDGGAYLSEDILDTLEHPHLQFM
jgi:hypothetical protein